MESSLKLRITKVFARQRLHYRTWERWHFERRGEYHFNKWQEFKMAREATEVLWSMVMRELEK
jgi:hypothetical protein